MIDQIEIRLRGWIARSLNGSLNGWMVECIDDKMNK